MRGCTPEIGRAAESKREQTELSGLAQVQITRRGHWYDQGLLLRESDGRRDNRRRRPVRGFWAAAQRTHDCGKEIVRALIEK